MLFFALSAHLKLNIAICLNYIKNYKVLANIHMSKDKKNWKTFSITGNFKSTTIKKKKKLLTKLTEKGENKIFHRANSREMKAFPHILEK